MGLYDFNVLTLEIQSHLKGRKCDVGKDKFTYLGHIFSRAGMEPEMSKVDAIKNWIRPRCQKEIKLFLGLASYYRRYIRDFATLAEPLNNILGKEVEFI